MFNKKIFSLALHASASYCEPNFTPIQQDNPLLGKIHQDIYQIIQHSKHPKIDNFKTNFHNQLCQYKDGWYNCGPASCFITQSKNIIRIAFTGTNDVGDVKNYFSFKKEYALFEPIIEKLIAYAKNNKCSFEACGHSLGGAMVEYFVDEINQEAMELSVFGITFGSPGSGIKNNWNNILNFMHSDDIVPKIGRILYHQHGNNVYITKPYQAFIAPHLAEEYVASLHYLSKHGFQFGSSNIIPEKGVFGTFNLEDQVHSINIPRQAFKPYLMKFTNFVHKIKETITQKQYFDTLGFPNKQGQINQAVRLIKHHTNL